MRNKLLCLLLCLTVLLSAGVPTAAARSYTVAEVDSLCDGIVSFKGGGSAQRFIDGALCDTAGASAEFYVIALSQLGDHDFSSYENALLRYLDTHEVYSASTREKYALALIASGSTNRYIAEVADEAIGGLGLMSLVFGLHLLNNGCESRLYTAPALVNTILSEQLGDGGWAVIGTRGDVDVTAMVLQSLAPYYYVYSDVEAAINRALNLLSNAQLDSGGFIGMGAENSESTAQVLMALSDLGIDAGSDSRFIKNNNSVLDALVSYRNADGSFSHIIGGGFNETATMEALCALTAYRRFCLGQGAFYLLDQRRPPYSHPSETAPQTSQDNQRSNNQNNSQKNNQNNASPQQNNAGGQSGNQNRSSQNTQSGTVNQTPAQSKSTEKPQTKETTTAKSTEATAAAPSQTPTESVQKSGEGLFQPTGTETSATVDEAQPVKKGGYKPYAIAAILAAAGIAALILFLLKKRGKNHYIAVAILAGAGVLFILLTNFESAESYRRVDEKTGASGSVTLSISCATITGDKPNHISDDGVILHETTFSIREGDTAYDILLEASKRYDIQIDNRGAAGNAYIAGIEYVYEFEYGDLSGWMYRVNGEFPDVGCQSCTLHDGDSIEWLYTKNIGKDLE